MVKYHFKMDSKTVSFFATIFMLYVMKNGAQDPISVYEGCFNEYADCGAVDVTPSPAKENQRFRLLPSLPTSTKLFVGGKEQFIRIDPSCAPDDVKVSIDIPSCDLNEPFNPRCGQIVSDLACNNYIRVVEEATTSKLLVCGTNNGKAKCFSFSNDCSLSVDGAAPTGQSCTDPSTIVYDAFDDRKIAPDVWLQNTTFGLIGTSIFYGSHNFDQDVTQDHSFAAKMRFTAAHVGTSTDPFIDHPIKTLENPVATSYANFVGRPYQYGDFVYFFFREVAFDIEYTGKVVHSRVARVCQNDADESPDDRNTKLLTFFKARLTVTYGGDLAKYFNDIHGVFPVPGPSGDTYFYAVFQTPETANAHSAMAMFKLSDINNVLDTSKYKSADDVLEFWTAQDPPTNVPNRPGSSADCSATYGLDVKASVETFIQKNTLVYDPVQSYYPPDATTRRPLFHAEGVRFTATVVDGQTDTTTDDDVIFLGTSSGQIWKVIWNSSGSKYEAVALWKSSDGSPITGLGLLKPASDVLLFGTTHNKVVKINLKHGKAQNVMQRDAIYKPYLTSPSDFPDALKVPMLTSKVQVLPETFCNGHQVRLFCRAHVDPVYVASSADTNWKFTPATPAGSPEVTIEASKLGQYFTFRRLRSGVADPASYLLIRTHTKTAGTYKCYVHATGSPDTELDSETGVQRHTINVQDCITPTYKTNQAARNDCLKTNAEAQITAYNNANPSTKIEVLSCSAGNDCPGA